MLAEGKEDDIYNKLQQNVDKTRRILSNFI
jgi:hypothetical protein